MSGQRLYDELVAELRLQSDLSSALHLLQWDQETYMPAGSAEARARQIGALAAVLHQRRTAPRFLDLVDQLAARSDELDGDAAADVRETKWRLDRQRVLETALVRERSELHATARAVWVEARRRNTFAVLRPYLERIVVTERRVALLIDSRRDPYEVLFEGYEPGTTVAQLEACFQQLRRDLTPLVERLRSLPSPGTTANALRGDFPVDRQRDFNLYVLRALGFDLARGRLDTAAHPFSMNVGGDVRLTTRYDAGDLRCSLYSTLHEGGHGLYEQGLDPEAWGLPRGQACSLAVHESQSRLWENIVGRSHGFWEHFLPIARSWFDVLRDASLPAVWRAANESGPSLIRTESDEITYNLHIILRYELERGLIAGTVTVADLPEAWRQGMQTFLGMTPTTERDGVLQDVHWASGAIGYFPTYTLGNIYAAELAASAEQSVGPLSDLLPRGEFQPLLAWLRSRVHRHGQRRRAHDLITAAVGRQPGPAVLLRHLTNKLDLLIAGP